MIGKYFKTLKSLLKNFNIIADIRKKGIQTQKAAIPQNIAKKNSRLNIFQRLLIILPKFFNSSSKKAKSASIFKNIY